jgi:hypothetical protein
MVAIAIVVILHSGQLLMAIGIDLGRGPTERPFGIAFAPEVTLIMTTG